MKTDKNEPINPVKNYGNCGAIGLTKREYYAGLAIQSLCPNYWKATENGDMYYENQLTQKIAQYAVMLADALIEELNKTEK